MELKKIIKILLVLSLFPNITYGAIGECIFFQNKKSLLNYPNPVDTSNLARGISQLIWNIIYFLRDCIIGPVLVLTIIVSGGYIMTSIGDPGKIQTGKAILIAAIVGLVIIFGGEAIVEVFEKYVAP